MFDDKWIDKEENSKLMDFVFKWLRPVSGVLIETGVWLRLLRLKGVSGGKETNSKVMDIVFKWLRRVRRGLTAVTEAEELLGNQRKLGQNHVASKEGLNVAVM